MAREVKSAAVIGAGVMGSGIAAHLANAGIPSYLLDIVPPKYTEEDKASRLSEDSKAFRNKFALKGIESALAAKPAAFFSKELASLITPGNIEDDLDVVRDVDWVVEVVVERLDIKQSVFQKIESKMGTQTIVTSNTSGIPLKDMARGRSETFRKNFLITHFFNPVRYMALLEIVPGVDTDPEVIETMVRFGEKILGKGIVYAKDTPNFIANRVGVYGMMRCLQLMYEKGYRVEEVDKIFGPAMGRPRSAIFRTADLVGLDTLVHVARNIHETVDDPQEKSAFVLPEFVQKMVDQGLLGEKSKAGFYKKIKTEQGKSSILSVNPKTLEYEEQQKPDLPCLAAAKSIEDLGERVKMIVNAEDRAGTFAWKATAETLLYSAAKIPEIADDIVNVDRAMAWGFAWKKGPFETWDSIGVKESVERMKKEGMKIPKNIETFLGKGGETFYKMENGKRMYWDLVNAKYVPIQERPGIAVFSDMKRPEKIVGQNMGASLIDIGDDVLCMEFHTKMNAIDGILIEMADKALQELQDNFKGLVLYNEGDNFSVGANLLMILMEARNNNWDNIERLVDGFQQANMRMRYSPRPVIAAPFNMALGGGCEIAMAADKIVASAELYMGLVEVGVGLIPAGTGCKEYIRHLLCGLPEGVDTDYLPFLQKAIQTVGMGKVSFSAVEARMHGYLLPSDTIVLNRESLLQRAKNEILAMDLAGYVQPKPKEDFKLPGNTLMPAVKTMLWGMKNGGFITDHDEKVTLHLARIFTGGDIAPGQLVSEQHILDLEKEAFLSLCGEEKSQARMEHMLTTGKPLRN